jgi:hypothetical protein
MFLLDARHKGVGWWVIISYCLFVCVGAQDELYMNGAVVLPHKEIKESVHQPAIIL